MLTDNSNVYTYGLGNLSQTSGAATDYFMGDALGSTRQLTDGSGQVDLTQSYDPFGSTNQTYGTAQTSFGFDGQQTDSYIKLIDLRSRMYDKGRSFLNVCA